MSANENFYTGKNENPFKVKIEVIDGETYYKVENKNTEVSNNPNIPFGLGDAINLAKDIFPKLASPQCSLFLTSITFSKKLYVLTQKSIEKQKKNPDLDMEVEYTANIIEAGVSSVLSIYGGGATGKKLLDILFKDSPLYQTITGRIKGDISDGIGKYVADLYREKSAEFNTSLNPNSDTNKLEDIGDGNFIFEEKKADNSDDSSNNYADTPNVKITINPETGTVTETYPDGSMKISFDNSIKTINTDGSKEIIENKNNSLVKTSYDKDENITSSVALEEGQTISHIAQNTPYNSIELLEYNNLTLEQAKHLPVGFEVQIPKDVTVVDGEYGAIKIFEGYDETGVIVTPNEKITYDENSDLLIYGDNDKITFTNTDGTNPDKITYVDEVTNNYVEISKDSIGLYYKSLESNNKNLLLNTFFCPTYSLQRENLYSLSLLSSHKILSSSLEIEKNRISNNRFYKRKVV